MNNIRKYETDQTAELQNLVDQMNRLHSLMGGRDSRPERIVLIKCIKILSEEIARYRKQLGEMD